LDVALHSLSPLLLALSVDEAAAVVVVHFVHTMAIRRLKQALQLNLAIRKWRF
jgi:hypothetical protein